MLKIIKKNSAYLLLGIILFSHVLIFTKLIYFPYPEVFIYPYLTNHGLKPYSQILDQHFPGLLFLPINFNNLGLSTPEIARVWSIIIVLIIQVLLFLIASEIFKSKTKALLINLLFLVWNPFFEGWVLWLDSFLPLILLPAFYVLYKRKLFITGIILGLGIVFKQTVVPLSFLTLIYIYWTTKNLKGVSMFLIGLFIPISLMILYLLSIGVFKDFWYWTVIFNLTTYAHSGTKAPPSSGFISRVMFVYGASLLALLNWKNKVVPILFIFITGSLLGAFERADFVHSQPLLPFIILATVIGLMMLWKWKKIAVVVILGYIFVAAWWLNIFYKGHLSKTVIAFDLQTQNIAARIKELTHPGEKIFVYGAEPQLYQMSKTLPAGDIFIFQFPWFMKIAQDRILEGIVRDKPNIIIADTSVIIEGAKISDFAARINQYINEHYRKIDSIGTTDILKRKIE